MPSGTGRAPAATEDALAPETKGAWSRWRSRPSIRSIRRDTAGPITPWANTDRRMNEESRLPTDESIRMAGLVLVELFTPSTVGRLIDNLERLPTKNPKQKNEIIASLANGRHSLGRSGWQNLAIIRPVGNPTFGDGFNDSLPPGVDAVWLGIHYATSSLTAVVATFTYSEEYSDISDIFRRDYHSFTSIEEVQVRVKGPFAGLRSKIPWHRPRRYTVHSSPRTADFQKKEAYEALATERKKDCWDWFAGKFSGRYAQEELSQRPVARLILTRASTPFQDRLAHFAPAGLSAYWDVWRSSEGTGWYLKFRDNVSDISDPHMMTFAAKTSEADGGNDSAHPKESVWYITQNFHSEQSELIVRWAINCLLRVYSKRLAQLRDQSRLRRAFGHPVREARNMDDFLLGDGLDASTVTSDLQSYTGELKQFRWNVPEYTLDESYLSGEDRTGRDEVELIPQLCKVIRQGSERLVRDMASITVNMNTSAELRQAIANTRLQRSVVFLSAIATIAAVVSLIVAVKAG
jgi:hypothetical protein